MRIQKLLSFVLAGAVLFGAAGCGNAPIKSEVKARFCADNEILTYETVDL